MYKYKDIYTIDFRNIKYYLEVHTIIKEALDFPDYYGENWDAFLDAFRTVGVPDRIIITGESTVPKDLLPELKRMHSTLDYIRAELSGFGQTFSYEIKD